MARGKSINVYLIDGTANGKIKAQISNWNGIAYKIPRVFLSDCKEFEAFRQSGVYFLFGYKSVYVGQAEVRKNGKGIHQRILDHETDKYKDKWDEVVIFTTKDNSFGRTDISYLENRFYNKAVDAGNYTIHNGMEPTIGTVTEEKESELEEFIDQAELILGALGYKVFECPVMSESMVMDKPALPSPKTTIPPLPDSSLKIGEYVRTAMRNLSQSGYVFSQSAIDEMCTQNWATKTFHTKFPFMKRYVKNKTTPKGIDGRNRFWSEVFAFGIENVYITKEWYSRQLHYFNMWYQSLKASK